MSLCKLLPSLLVATLAVGLAAPRAAEAQTVDSGIVVTGVNLEGVAYDPLNGALTATGGTVTGTFLGRPFTTEITNFVLELVPAGESGACSVLDLELGPIDLDLLGLHGD